MSRILDRRLNRLLRTGQQGLLRVGRIGLEKESLRVAPDGSIARTPHPEALGSALTNPYITTDYSEALLEFITPPFGEMRESLRFLSDIHRFVYDNLDDEFLWATSMPCVVGSEDNIPIADYGTSNSGMIKHIYRRGLSYRYGKAMQVIAGVHFNFSPGTEFWPVYQDQEQDARQAGDFINASYFGLIRNLQRFGWLLLYLFGASPALCKSFLTGRHTDLPEFDRNTYFGPYATSLRMSDLGYRNKSDKKSPLRISYNSLDEYIASLSKVIDTPCPDYQKIGVKVGGQYRQLNANILQIENEYYSTMRPKQVQQGHERPLLALRRRGVQYVELRAIDINAFEPLGINEDQLRFLEAFLIFCLLHDSPPVTVDERDEINKNQLETAVRGRDPGLFLQHGGKPLALRDWAGELCAMMQGVCDCLDSVQGGQAYARALALQQEAVAEVDATPSARILAEMRQAGEAFFHFAKRMSLLHKDYFKTVPADSERTRLFAEAAEQSRSRQAQIEASERYPLDEYLQRYLAQS